MTSISDVTAVLGRPPTAELVSELLWRMSPDERVSAMQRGELTFAQLREWTAQAPSEVPRDASGEFVWIAVTTPEYAG